jgi:hypothetical protein
LTLISRHHPVYAQEIQRMAETLCEGQTQDAELFAQALVIAECQTILRIARAERVRRIERLRDPLTFPLSAGDRRLAAIKLRCESTRAAEREFSNLLKIASKPGQGLRRVFEGYVDEHDYPEARYEPHAERDEFEMVRLAHNDLRRIERYERRAMSRANRAKQRFTAIVLSRLASKAST